MESKFVDLHVSFMHPYFLVDFFAPTNQEISFNLLKV